MFYPKPLIVLNRLAGIVAWVGIWNILDMIDHDSIVVNGCYALIGMLVWTASGEFNEPEKYVQIVEPEA